MQGTLVALSTIDTRNVTRFGEISTLWQNHLSLWQYFAGIFRIWQNDEIALVNFASHLANFHSCNEQILKNNLAIWSHWIPDQFSISCHFLRLNILNFAIPK